MASSLLKTKKKAVLKDIIGSMGAGLSKSLTKLPSLSKTKKIKLLKNIKVPKILTTIKFGLGKLKT